MSKLAIVRPHAPLRADPPRHRNYSLYRERDTRDIPWHRPTDFKTLDLPRPIVLVNGAFDILHASHMRLIFAARHKAATLICALDSDEKICKEKGASRPILSWIERATALNYMPIDGIVEICNQRDMNTLINNLQPDLRVQSEAYRYKVSRYPQIPKMLVRDSKLHTTTIINRILSAYASN